jgi:exosome complex exonuclease DIS3/RRP44
MTEDMANYRKAKNEGIPCVSGWCMGSTTPHTHVDAFCVVRTYVEGMKGSNELLDLLSAGGSGDIEPTRAAASRTALYPDVRRPTNCLGYC